MKEWNPLWYHAFMKHPVCATFLPNYTYQQHNEVPNLIGTEAMYVLHTIAEFWIRKDSPKRPLEILQQFRYW